MSERKRERVCHAHTHLQELLILKKRVSLIWGKVRVTSCFLIEKCLPESDLHQRDVLHWNVHLPCAVNMVSERDDDPASIVVVHVLYGVDAHVPQLPMVELSICRSPCAYSIVDARGRLAYREGVPGDVARRVSAHFSRI